MTLEYINNYRTQKETESKSQILVLATKAAVANMW